MVDGAILDVGNFSRRHPGGARVIMNALGTDITNEVKGEDFSVGNAMSFSHNQHSEVREHSYREDASIDVAAWEFRSLSLGSTVARISLGEGVCERPGVYYDL